MKTCHVLVLCLPAIPAAAHPGHTDGVAETVLHALVGHAPALGIGLLTGVVCLGLLARVMRARRRQLDRRGQLGM